MAQKSEKVYFADVYNAVFLFHKKWSRNNYTDSEFEQLIAEATELRNKCIPNENNPLYKFFTDMLCGALLEIDRHNGATGFDKSIADYHLKQMMRVLGTNDKEKIIELIRKSEEKN